MDTRPPVVAKPNSCAAASNSAQVHPPPTLARRAAASMSMAFIGRTSMTSPSSLLDCPATEWPPERTATGRTSWAARSRASLTSAGPSHAAMTRGFLLIIALNSSAGPRTRPLLVRSTSSCSCLLVSRGTQHPPGSKMVTRHQARPSVTSSADVPKANARRRSGRSGPGALVAPTMGSRRSGEEGAEWASRRDHPRHVRWRRNAAPLMGLPLATERGLQVRAPQVATPTCDWMMRLAWRGHTRAGPDSVTMPVMPGWVTQLRIRSMVRR